MIEKIFIGGSRVNELCGVIPDIVCKKLDEVMDNNYSILIGDANGVDRMVQEYLKKKGYRAVTVYYSGEQIRNNADSLWLAKHITSDNNKKMSKREIQTLKDEKMAEYATAGYMIWSDTYVDSRFGNKCVSSGTMLNIINLLLEKKLVTIYYIPDGREYFINDIGDFEENIFPRLDPLAQKKWTELLLNKTKPVAIGLFD